MGAKPGVWRSAMARWPLRLEKREMMGCPPPGEAQSEEPLTRQRQNMGKPRCAFPLPRQAGGDDPSVSAVRPPLPPAFASITVSLHLSQSASDPALPRPSVRLARRGSDGGLRVNLRAGRGVPWAAVGLVMGWDVVTITEALEPLASPGLRGTHVPRGRGERNQSP